MKNFRIALLPLFALAIGIDISHAQLSSAACIGTRTRITNNDAKPKIYDNYKKALDLAREAKSETEASTIEYEAFLAKIGAKSIDHKEGEVTFNKIKTQLGVSQNKVVQSDLLARKAKKAYDAIAAKTITCGTTPAVSIELIRLISFQFDPSTGKLDPRPGKYEKILDAHKVSDLDTDIQTDYFSVIKNIDDLISELKTIDGAIVAVSNNTNDAYKTAFTWWQKNKGWVKPALWGVAIAGVVAGAMALLDDDDSDSNKENSGGQAEAPPENAPPGHAPPGEAPPGEDVAVAVDENQDNQAAVGNPTDPSAGAGTVTVTDPNEGDVDIVAVNQNQNPAIIDQNPNGTSGSGPTTVPSVITSVPAQSGGSSSSSSSSSSGGSSSGGSSSGSGTVTVTATDFCNGNAACIAAAGGQNLVGTSGRRGLTRSIASNSGSGPEGKEALEEMCLNNKNSHRNCGAVLEQLKLRTQKKKKSIWDLLK